MSCKADMRQSTGFDSWRHPQSDPRPDIGMEKKNGTYSQTSNTSRTLAGNKIVDHPDVVGASPVGAAPTTSSFST